MLIGDDVVAGYGGVLRCIEDDPVLSFNCLVLLWCSFDSLACYCSCELSSLVNGIKPCTDRSVNRVAIGTSSIVDVEEGLSTSTHKENQYPSW